MKTKEELLELFNNYSRDLVFTNFVVNAQLDLNHVNVEYLAIKKRGSSWRKSVFASLRIINSSPKTTCSVFSDGRMSSMGAQTEAAAMLAVRKHIITLNTVHGLKCRLKWARVRNVVASVKVFPVDLDKMRSLWSHLLLPKVTFPGAYFYYRQVMATNVVIAIFQTGSINFIGGRSKEEVYDVFKHFYENYLVHVRLDCSQLPKDKSVAEENETDAAENEHLSSFMDMDDQIQNVLMQIKMGISQ